MDRFWSARVKGLSPYVAGEQPRDGQFIKLNTNENPYPAPQAVLMAMRAAANEKLRLYPDPNCVELRNVIAETYHVDAAEVFVGNGSDEVLAFAFAAFFNCGSGAEKILFPEITYSFYPVYANLWDVPFSAVPLCEDWSINVNDYLTRCGGVVIANPNAPTGIEMKAADILRVADFQLDNEALIIVDEAYADFGNESVVPFLKRNIAMRENILVVKTLSKSFSLAGLRVGFALGHKDLINALCRMRDSFNSYTIDRVAQAGAAAAISEIHYFNDINKKIIATREWVSKKLIELDFTVLPSAANFIFIKHPKLSGAEFFAHLRGNGILARHFGNAKIKDFIRVTIGTGEQMEKFIRSVV
jgi:histidinol-phosphate aminotransferase